MDEALANSVSSPEHWSVVPRPVPGACQAEGVQMGSQGMAQAYLALLEMLMVFFFMAQHNPLARLLLQVMGRLSATAQGAATAQARARPEGAASGHFDGLSWASSSKVASPLLRIELEPDNEVSSVAEVAGADVASREADAGCSSVPVPRTGSTDPVLKTDGSGAGGRRPVQGRRIRRRLVVMRRASTARKEGGQIPAPRFHSASSSVDSPSCDVAQGSNGEPRNSQSQALASHNAPSPPCSTLHSGSNTMSHSSSQDQRHTESACEQCPLPTWSGGQVESESLSGTGCTQGAECLHRAASHGGSFPEQDLGTLRTALWVQQTGPTWAFGAHPDATTAALVCRGDPRDGREDADGGSALPVCAADLSAVHGGEQDLGDGNCSSALGATQSSGSEPSSQALVCVVGPSRQEPYHSANGDPPAEGDKCLVTWAEVVRQVLCRETDRAASGALESASGAPEATCGAPESACGAPELRLGAGDRGPCQEEEAGMVEGASNEDCKMVEREGPLLCVGEGVGMEAQACLEALLAEGEDEVAGEDEDEVAGEDEEEVTEDGEGGPDEVGGVVHSSTMSAVGALSESVNTVRSSESSAEDSPPTPMASSRPSPGSWSESPVSEASFSNWTEAPDAAFLEGCPPCITLAATPSPLADAELPPAPPAVPQAPSHSSDISLCSTGSSTGSEGARSVHEKKDGSVNPADTAAVTAPASAAGHLDRAGSERSASEAPEAPEGAPDPADRCAAFIGLSDPPESTSQNLLGDAKDLSALALGIAPSFSAAVPESASLEGSPVYLSGTDSLGGTDSMVHTGSTTGSNSSGSHAHCGPPEGKLRTHIQSVTGAGSSPQVQAEEGKGRGPEGVPGLGAAEVMGEAPPSGRGSVSGMPTLPRCHSVSEAEKAKGEASRGRGGLGAFLGRGGLFSGSFLKRPSKKTDIQASPVGSRGTKGYDGTTMVPLQVPQKVVLASATPQATISFDLGILGNVEVVKASMHAAELPWVDYREIVQAQQHHEQELAAGSFPPAEAAEANKSSGLQSSRGRGPLQRDRRAKGAAKKEKGKGLPVLGACGPGAFGALSRVDSFPGEIDDDEPGLALVALGDLRDRDCGGPGAGSRGGYQSELVLSSGFIVESHRGPLEAVLEEDTLSSEQLEGSSLNV